MTKVREITALSRQRYCKVPKDRAVPVSDWASRDKSRLRALFSGPQSLMREVR